MEDAVTLSASPASAAPPPRKGDLFEAFWAENAQPSVESMLGASGFDLTPFMRP